MVSPLKVNDETTPPQLKAEYLTKERSLENTTVFLKLGKRRLPALVVCEGDAFVAKFDVALTPSSRPTDRELKDSSLVAEVTLSITHAGEDEEDNEGFKYTQVRINKNETEGRISCRVTAENFSLSIPIAMTVELKKNWRPRGSNSIIAFHKSLRPDGKGGSFVEFDEGRVRQL